MEAPLYNRSYYNRDYIKVGANVQWLYLAIGWDIRLPVEGWTEQNPRLLHPIQHVSMTISRRDYKEFSI